MKQMKQKRNSRFRSMFRLNDESKVVARGFALGSFVGMLPFPGFQMIISATLAALFRYNKTAAIAGVFNTNLATGAFVFAFNYWLGKKLLGIESSFQVPERITLGFIKTIADAGSEVFISLLAGGLITGILAMFIGYHISLMIITKKQKPKNGN